MHLRRGQHWIGIFAFFFALLVNGRMFAGVTASISGTVKDSSGASIPGATVTGFLLLSIACFRNLRGHGDAEGV
jgi:hypothetical protein